jgi:hypothetical protein
MMTSSKMTLNMITLSIMILSIMTLITMALSSMLRMMTLMIMTLKTMTLNIVTLNIMALNVKTLRITSLYSIKSIIIDTQHNIFKMLHSVKHFSENSNSGHMMGVVMANVVAPFLKDFVSSFKVVFF